MYPQVLAIIQVTFDGQEREISRRPEAGLIEASLDPRARLAPRLRAGQLSTPLAADHPHDDRNRPGNPKFIAEWEAFLRRIGRLIKNGEP